MTPFEEGFWDAIRNGLKSWESSSELAKDASLAAIRGQLAALRSIGGRTPLINPMRGFKRRILAGIRAAQTRKLGLTSPFRH